MQSEVEKLVERLRNYRPPVADGYGYPVSEVPREHHPICDEAASLIERLYRERDEAIARADRWEPSAEVKANISAMIDGTSPMSKWVTNVDYTTLDGFEDYLKAQLRQKLQLKVGLDRTRAAHAEDEHLAAFVDGGTAALEGALATYRFVRTALAEQPQ